MHEPEVRAADLARDLHALEPLVEHHHLVELDAQQPRRLQLGLEVALRHEQVRLQQLLVLLDDRLPRVRVVPAPGAPCLHRVSLKTNAERASVYVGGWTNPLTRWG